MIGGRTGGASIDVQIGPSVDRRMIHRLFTKLTLCTLLRNELLVCLAMLIAALVGRSFLFGVLRGKLADRALIARADALDESSVHSLRHLVARIRLFVLENRRGRFLVTLLHGEITEATILVRSRVCLCKFVGC